MGKPLELLQGTLDTLISKAVSLGQILQGSVYPALYRFEHQGWIASAWANLDPGSDQSYPEGRRGWRALARPPSPRPRSD